MYVYHLNTASHKLPIISKWHLLPNAVKMLHKQIDRTILFREWQQQNNLRALRVDVIIFKEPFWLCGWLNSQMRPLWIVFFFVCGMWMAVGRLDVMQRNESDFFLSPFVRATFICPSCMPLYLVLQNFHQEDFVPTWWVYDPEILTPLPKTTRRSMTKLGYMPGSQMPPLYFLKGGTSQK